MTKYDERNYSKKEMDLEEPKAFLTAKKSQQRLIVLTFNSSHWHCSRVVKVHERLEMAWFRI
jgi:hypothetical protein